MGWLAAVVAFLAVVYFSIVFPSFRKFLGILTLAVIALAVAIYLYIQRQNLEDEKQRQLARSRIPTSSAAFQDFRLLNEYGSWNVKGVVKNNSANFVLKELSLTVSISNCDSNGSNCVIVGVSDQVGDYKTLNIPPGQARAFDKYVFFSNLPPLRNWTWSYRINYIEAASK